MSCCQHRFFRYLIRLNFDNNPCIRPWDLFWRPRGTVLVETMIQRRTSWYIKTHTLSEVCLNQPITEIWHKELPTHIVNSAIQLRSFVRTRNTVNLSSVQLSFISQTDISDLLFLSIKCAKSWIRIVRLALWRQICVCIFQSSIIAKGEEPTGADIWMELLLTFGHVTAQICRWRVSNTCF